MAAPLTLCNRLLPILSQARVRQRQKERLRPKVASRRYVVQEFWVSRCQRLSARCVRDMRSRCLNLDIVECRHISTDLPSLLHLLSGSCSASDIARVLKFANTRRKYEALRPTCARCARIHRSSLFLNLTESNVSTAGFIAGQASGRMAQRPCKTSRAGSATSDRHNTPSNTRDLAKALCVALPTHVGSRMAMK